MWIHYSKKPIKKLKYTKPGHDDELLPNGFWVATPDEVNYLGDPTKDLRYRVVLDFSKLYVFDSAKSIEKFYKKYRYKRGKYPETDDPDWKYIDSFPINYTKVAKDYAGVIATRKIKGRKKWLFFNVAFGYKAGVIWDPDAIKELYLSRV